jgi:hypothetical protein
MDNWQGGLGLNWHHNYEFKLAQAGDKVKVTFDDGHLEDFTLNEDGTYTAMPGKYGKLESLANGGYKLTQNVSRTTEVSRLSFHKFDRCNAVYE